MNILNSTSLIHVIGVDAGGVDNLPKTIQSLILSVDKIAASKRILENLPGWLKEKQIKRKVPEFFSIDKPNDLISWLTEHEGSIVVLASGDPLYFGIGRILLEYLPKERLKFYPNVSSFQLAFSRLKLPWQDAEWVSLHGRDINILIDILNTRPKYLAILTDPQKGNVEEVRTTLKALCLENSYQLWFFERLGHINERVFRINPFDPPIKDANPLNILVLIALNDSPKELKDIPLFGIDDSCFHQYQDRPGLMTKKEVRVQLLAELELPFKGVLWDLGAGVGSIGLEALRIRPLLKLLCVEKRVGGGNLIKLNAKNLDVEPAFIIEKEIVELLKERNLPSVVSKPDRVILGGGGETRLEILNLIFETIKPGGIIVIPLVTIESVSELMSFFESRKCKTRFGQIQSFRGVPLVNGTRLAPMNPVFILKGIVGT